MHEDTRHNNKPTETARYLHSVLQFIKRLRNPKGFDDRHGAEKLRKNGMWIYPDAVKFNFKQACKIRRLQGAIANGEWVEVISPSAYYHLPVFVWLPALMDPEMKVKCATCGGMRTQCHGDYHWRRICSVPVDYYVLSERYKCMECWAKADQLTKLADNQTCSFANLR